MRQILPQQCPLPFLYLTWAVYLGGLLALLLRAGLFPSVLWLVGFPAALWLYVRTFPMLSQWLGYGRVDDVGDPGSLTAPDREARGMERVTVYTSAGCPFCPIVVRRLRALQEAMGFDLSVVDVTLRPERVLSQQIRAVPLVVVGDRRHVGHATTQELVQLLRGDGEGMRA